MGLLRLGLVLFATLALSAAHVFAQNGGRRGGDRAARMWERLKRFDENGDGKVTKEEFTGPERMFQRLDGDADGVVTEDEVKQMAARMGGRRGRRGQGEDGPGESGRGGGVSGRLLRRFDSDDDGKIDAKEWAAFHEKADKNGDGVLDREEITAALNGRKARDPAPAVGADAPAVEARDAKSGKMVNLRRVSRPTVLVFGSWT